MAGLATGVGGPIAAPVRPREAVTSRAAVPTEATPASWSGRLYGKAAAEYRAAAIEAYNLATTASVNSGRAKGNGKPLAVVLDLGETALDNAGYQAMLLRGGLAYDQRLWDMWEGQYDDFVGLIPGEEFIGGKQVLTAVYISNRSEKFRNSAITPSSGWASSEEMNSSSSPPVRQQNQTPPGSGKGYTPAVPGG